MSWNKWMDGKGRPVRASRRAFIGGSAAAIALPFLPSLTPRAFAGDAAAKRAVYWYCPNGFKPAEWRPTTLGANWGLSPTLEPLADMKEFVSVISGLDNDGASMARTRTHHFTGTGTLFTCFATDPTMPVNVTSADQVVANHWAGQAPFRSIQLRATPDPGYFPCAANCSFLNTISWADDSTPLAPMTDPRQVFERLFSGFDLRLTRAQRAARRRWRSSVLDQALDDIQTLDARLSSNDKVKLDQYLTGVRELETRLNSEAGTCDPLDIPSVEYSHPERMKLLIDLMVVAIHCDLSRVFSFMMENAVSYRTYDFLGQSGTHHQHTHGQVGAAIGYASCLEIEKWEIAQFAYFLSELQRHTDVDGTNLLDNTLVVLANEMSDSNRHIYDNLPVLLAGGAGGVHKSGTHIDYENRPLSELYLTMFQMLDIPETSFGMLGENVMSELV